MLNVSTIGEKQEITDLLFQTMETKTMISKKQLYTVISRLSAIRILVD